MLNFPSTSSSGILTGNKRNKEIHVRLDQLLLALLRHRTFILFMVGLFLLVGIAIRVLIPSEYSASGQVLLNAEPTSFSPPGTLNSNTGPDIASIENQIQILKSDRIALEVIKTLGLISEWQKLMSTGFGTFFGFNSKSADQPQEAKLETIRLSFQSRLLVERLGRSHVLRVGFTSPDPVLSARITNQIIGVFIDDKFPSLNKLGGKSDESFRNRFVLVRATVPTRADGPSAKILAASSAFLGLLLGSLLVFVREYFDDAVKTPEQASIASNLFCMGIFPIVTRRPGDLPLAPRLKPATNSRVLPTKSVVKQDLKHNNVVELPVTETLAVIKATMNQLLLPNGPMILGITSALPREGKTTLALNLARLLSDTGDDSLLVDCHFRHPELSRKLSDTNHDETRAQSPSKQWSELIRRDDATHVHFLPLEFSPTESSSIRNQSNERQVSVEEMVVWKQLPLWIHENGQNYKWIILDMPPILPFGSIQSLAGTADILVLVSEWGKTPNHLLTKSMALLEPIRNKFIGIVLNKVNLKLLWELDHDSALIYSSKFADVHTRETTESNAV